MLSAGMVDPQTYRIWERQRAIAAAAEEQQRRTRALIEAARERVRLTREVLRLT